MSSSRVGILVKIAGFAGERAGNNKTKLPAAMAKRRTSTLVLFLEPPFLGIMVRCFIEAPTPVVCRLGME